MSTFGVYTFPVAASLLDVATGVSLLPATWPLRTQAPDGVLRRDRAGAPVFAEARRASYGVGRRVAVTVDPADADAFSLVRQALDAAAGGAGLIEWRHPDDDPGADPTLWRLAPDAAAQFARAAGSPHQTRFELTLEEF